MMNERHRPNEAEDTTLIIEKYGLKVLRQLSREELNLPETKELTTPEGFVINGTNSSELIRSLKSLNSTPITQLERSLRPGSDSHAGFLGPNESLVSIMAEDNDTVSELGLSHAQLADFLNYFESVQQHLDQQHLPEYPQAYAYNGRTYICNTTAYRGMQFSPFRDGTGTNKDHLVICLDDGSALAYSGLLAHLIRRYGFYEGKGTPYRLYPREIAELAGYLPKPADDPIVELASNPSADVNITSTDQFFRLVQLLPYRQDLYEASGLKLRPQDIDTLFGFMSALIDEYGGEELAIRSNKFLADHLTTNHLQSSSYIAKRHTAGILRAIPKYLPSQQKTMTEAITSIDVSELPDVDLHLLTRNLIDLAMYNPSAEAYVIDLLRKYSNPINFNGILSAIKEILPEFPGPNEDRVARISRARIIIDKLDPSFKDQLSALYHQYDIQTEGQDLEDYLKIIGSVDRYINVIAKATKFIQQIGRIQEVNEADVMTLVRVIGTFQREPDYQPNAEEQQTLTRLRVDPTLIPYAIKAASNSERDHIVAQLYNGQAAEQKAKEETFSRLPENLAPEDRKLIDDIITYEKRAFSDKIDVEDFTKLLSELEVINQGKIIEIYVSLKVPEFTSFLTSNLVGTRISTSSFLSPIEFYLIPSEIDKLPEVPREGYYAITADRQATFGDQVFTVSSYEIKHGKRSLPVRNNQISLSVRENRQY